MAPKIGIPRALHYYNYFPLWKTFFTELGAKVVLSPPTNRRVLDAGVKHASSEVCLPVKVYLGHIDALRHEVDYLFVPRLVTLEKDAYTCPKYIGLPDLVRHAYQDLPPLIAPLVDVKNRPVTAVTSVLNAGTKLEGNPLRIWRAHKRGVLVQQAFEAALERGADLNLALQTAESLGPAEFLAWAKQLPAPAKEAGLKVAVLGHEYNLYDELVSQRLIAKLKAMGATVVTGKSVSRVQIKASLSRLGKTLFWTFERELLGAAFHFQDDPTIAGVVNVASFECGPDSMVEQLLEYERSERACAPMLKLTLDEHTGEAALDTRLEAFVDMLKRARTG